MRTRKRQQNRESHEDMKTFLPSFISRFMRKYLDLVEFIFRSSPLSPRKVEFFSTLLIVLLYGSMFSACTPVRKPYPQPDILKEQPTAPLKGTTTTKIVKKKEILHPQEPVIILFNNKNLEYSSLVSLLERELDPKPTIVTLNSLSIPRLPESGSIVAIGEDAAQLAAGLGSKRSVLFAMVMNYGSQQFLSQEMIGVSMLPPPDKVLSVFTKLNPTVGNIAIISGTGLDDYLDFVRVAARQSNLQITHKVVSNDKEMLLEGKKLDPSITAFWLLPDNRVLSRRTLRELMSANVKVDRRQIVFSPSLFAFGGMMSAKFDSRSTSETITSILKMSDKERDDLRGEMVQPQDAEIEINLQMVKTLGLETPLEFKSPTKDY